MRVSQNQSTAPTVALVCCVHGNERYGLTVFEYFAARIADYPGLKIILANEPAIEQNVRFVETDLNRSFPGSSTGSAEERLAVEILREIAGIPIVLDVHTTTSDVSLVPIVTTLGSETRRVAGLTGSREIVLIEPPMSARSLIGNIAAGISLEYGNAYAARPSALAETVRLVESVLSCAAPKPSSHDIFHVTGGIPDTISLPDGATNFSFVPAANAYAILLHEAAYVGLHALAATERTTEIF
jgi:succinylglutamate desuccinylase